jgi:hypothetical protein
VGELIQRDLGYLVQGFVNSATGISRFWGLGELYRPTDPGTDQLWPWGLEHIKGYVQLHILSSGVINPGGPWLFVAGVWEFPQRNFEIFVFGGTIAGNGCPHRLAMDMGVLAYQSSRQTAYSIRWWNISMVILASWCRGLGVSHRNFEIFSSRGNFSRERLPPQTSYGDRGWCILKSTSNYILYQEAGSSQ